MGILSRLARKGLSNPMRKKKVVSKRRWITVSEYNAYSNANRPWYKRKELMTKKQFDKRARSFRAKELAETGRGPYPSRSWKKKYLNELHD